MTDRQEPRKPSITEAGLLARISELEAVNSYLLDRCTHLSLQVQIVTGQISVPDSLVDPESAQPPAA